MSRLRVDVPAPAYWALELDGVPHPVGAWVPVAPGPVRAVLRLRVPLPGRQAEGSVTFVACVRPGTDHDVSLPFPDVVGPATPAG